MRKIGIGIIAILLFVRLMLPGYIQNSIVEAVNATEGYRCELHDVDLALYRGAIQLDSFRIFATDNTVELPFFSAKQVEGSIHWKSLIKGKIVSTLTLIRPVVNFADGDSESEEQIGGTDWTEPLREMVPTTVNVLKIQNGKIRFVNRSSNPPVDLSISNINVFATNLSNVVRDTANLPSLVKVKATVFGTGALDIGGRMNVIKNLPDFDLALKLTEVKLTEMNDLVSAYGSVDFENGQFNMASEYAMKDGRFRGYVKPIFKDVKVLDLDEEDKAIWKKFWEGLVGAGFEVSENQPRSQTATKVPIQGDVSDVATNTGTVVWNLFKNAFIEAFTTEIDNSIEYQDLE
jgi:hypothetical protein